MNKLILIKYFVILLNYCKYNLKNLTATDFKSDIATFVRGSLWTIALRRILESGKAEYYNYEI